MHKKLTLRQTIEAARRQAEIDEAITEILAMSNEKIARELAADGIDVERHFFPENDPSHPLSQIEETPTMKTTNPAQNDNVNPKEIEHLPANDNDPKPPRPKPEVARGLVLALAGYDVTHIDAAQRWACAEVARCFKARLYDVSSIRAATGLSRRTIRAAIDTLRFTALSGTITG